MVKEILDFTICPYCGSTLDLGKIIGKDKNEVTWALLSCKECRFIFPIVEGIPIIMPPQKRLNVFGQINKESTEKIGPTISEICSFIHEGQIESVKELIIYSIPYEKYISPQYIDILPESLLKLSGKQGKRVIRKVLRSSYFKNFCSKSVKNVLESERCTAFEALRIYYQSHELFNYFFYKFGQPRFLGSLGLASILDNPQKPILDLACGQGHLMHFLTKKYNNSCALGIDRNFFQLYIAKKYIAPKGNYICAVADEKLPFKKSTFSTVICSDAFHYFQNKLGSIEDLTNLIDQDGMIIINRAGNRLCKPNEGTELSSNGYERLFDTLNVKIIGDNEVLDSYLKKRKPDLTLKKGTTALIGEKWLTIVASKNNQVFRNHNTFNEWPHAIGQLALNPLYKRVKKDENNSGIYKFRYPSDWYKIENSQWETYAPEEVRIPKKIISNLDKNKWIPEMEELIEKFVILGFPKNYFPAPFQLDEKNSIHAQK